jgi:Zn-dependent protease
MSDDPPDSPSPVVSPVPAHPEKPTLGKRIIKALGPVGVALLFVGKLLAKLKFILLPLVKFGLPILKTGGTMILSIGVYALAWGWKFALGFVLLIFVHECGHLLVARRFGLKVGAPVFIPFMGAFIALKEAPRDAWIEANVGIGGPWLGAIAAGVCWVIYVFTGQPLFAALAYTGFWLNLFNLIPIGFLDGGRIATALSPWLWILGLAVVIARLVMRPSFILVLVLGASIPRVISLFRKKTDAEKRYFEATPAQRTTIGLQYFGLVTALAWGMHVAESALATHR